MQGAGADVLLTDAPSKPRKAHATGPFRSPSMNVPSRSVRRSTRGWVKVTAGVEMRRLVEGEGTALVLYRLEPGLRFSPHHHPFPEYGTLVLGEAVVLLPAKNRPVGEGDSYYIPTGMEHGLETRGKTGPIVILHVAAGPSAPVRTPMFRHLVGHTRALVRSLAREPSSAGDPGAPPTPVAG